jgi:hypothetical protein
LKFTTLTKMSNCVIIAPETNMFLQYGRPSENSFNVSCVAEGVFPEPRMALYYSRPDVKDKALIKSASNCDTQIRSVHTKYHSFGAHIL